MSSDFGQQQFQRQQFRHKPSDAGRSEIDHDRIQRELVWRMFGVQEDEPTSLGARRRETKKEEERKELRESRANTVLTLALGGVIISSLTLLSFYVFAVAGGVMMHQLRNYQLCRVACILAMIPVISPLIVVGIPFGVIGLAKLRDPDVKRAFI